MDKNEALQVIRSNYPTDRNQLCEALETLIPELKESEYGKPCGGIVLEDFNGGKGFYKVNLAYLNKEQVIEIEELVKKWNPELKESEDERIRKECISIIDAWDKSCRLQSDYCEGIAPKCIAWLEKQGEQKPTTIMSYREIFPKFSVGDTLCRQGYANHTVKKIYIDNINTTYICENDEGLESHIEISEQEKWYKIEKKPAWSEEDEKERKRVVGLLEGWLSTFNETSYAEDCKCGISWLNSLKQRMKGE